MSQAADSHTVSTVVQIAVALISGGVIAALIRWRPEATSAAVQASEDAVAIVRGELNHLKGEVAELRAQVSELRVALRTAEREAGEWKVRYETEHALHIETKTKLTAAETRLLERGGRRIDDHHHYEDTDESVS